ncbi:MAG: hypothetical protein K9W43_09500 [Candidatus Thorarchaeota archaeon]|nr:hypothetical protein [Candidatus Thorarchaeota archaeon]
MIQEMVIFGIGVAMLLGFLVILLLFACRGFSTPSSGAVERPRPVSGDVDGISVSRSFDYSYAPGISGDKGGLPVSLRTEREKTDTWELAEEIHREETDSEQGH